MNAIPNNENQIRMYELNENEDFKKIDSRFESNIKVVIENLIPVQ